MITDIKRLTTQINSELDKISINTEVLESLNKLVYDKLDDIRQIDLSQTNEALLSKVYTTARNSECYISLNYLSTMEVCKINNHIATLFKKIKQIEDLLKETDALNNKGGVENE